MMLGGGIPRVLFEESTLLWHNGSNKGGCCLVSLGGSPSIEVEPVKPWGVCILVPPCFRLCGKLDVGRHERLKIEPRVELL